MTWRIYITCIQLYNMNTFYNFISIKFLFGDHHLINLFFSFQLAKMNEVLSSNKENSNPVANQKTTTGKKAALKPTTKIVTTKSTTICNKNPDQRKFRRTLSFINQKRKRATQFCTINRASNRRLSLNLSKKNKIPTSKEILSNSLEDSFTNSLPTDEEIFKAQANTLPNRRFSYFPPVSSFSSTSSSSSSLSSKKPAKFKNLKFRLKKRNNYEATLQLLQKQTLFDIDQRLKDYIQKQPDVSIDSSFEV